jgi:hydrogenase-4 component B
MSIIAFLMWLIAAQLATAVLAVAVVRGNMATPVIYSAALASSALLFTAVLVHFVGGTFVTLNLTLPLGLPWLGAHFRLDALAAFFLLVINLGGAAASLYGIGYGRHEAEPQRVLPFFPAFLAGMNLVVLADDAFTFLWSWEFMSLASWALVMTHHREEDNVRAGYVYIVMASIGTLALLLAFGLLAGPDGNYAFDAMRIQSRSPLWAGVLLGLVLLGTGSKAGLVPLHVWLPCSSLYLILQTAPFWLVGFVCLLSLKRRSFSPSQVGWRQGRFASASCRNTSGLDVASPRCSP